MPELPEVETIARGVDERVRGDRIVEVVRLHPQTFKTPPADQAKALKAAQSLQFIGLESTSSVELGSALKAAKTEQKLPSDPVDHRPISSSMDCASRHDRTVTCHDARQSGGQAHTRATHAWRAVASCDLWIRDASADLNSASGIECCLRSARSGAARYRRQRIRCTFRKRHCPSKRRC